jgi:hypothetical protein
MNLLEHSAWYKQMRLEQKFQQRTLELCDELMASLNIKPFNKELCSADKEYRYRNNHELVLAWVRSQACCPSCLKTVRSSKLKSKFVCWLLDHDFSVGDLH